MLEHVRAPYQNPSRFWLVSTSHHKKSKPVELSSRTWSQRSWPAAPQMRLPWWSQTSSTKPAARPARRPPWRAAPVGCYPLVMTNVAIEAMAIEIVDYYPFKMVMFDSYVNVYQRAISKWESFSGRMVRRWREVAVCRNSLFYAFLLQGNGFRETWKCFKVEQPLATIIDGTIQTHRSTLPWVGGGNKLLSSTNIAAIQYDSASMLVGVMVFLCVISSALRN